MRIRAAFVAIVLFLIAVGTADAVTISDDGGGEIGTYLAKYRALRESGERVEIAGTCASACTMVLGIIPRNRICIAPGARLVFHSAWDTAGDQRIAAEGNRILWASYPERVRHWIERHGGLHTRLITLSGRELAAMFPTCR